MKQTPKDEDKAKPPPKDEDRAKPPPKNEDKGKPPPKNEDKGKPPPRTRTRVSLPQERGQGKRQKIEPFAVGCELDVYPTRTARQRHPGRLASRCRIGT